MDSKEKFIVNGLAGERRLKGKISVNGAKNAALKAMAGSVLFNGEVCLQNIPNTEDILTMKEILEDLGASVNWLSDDINSKTLKIDTSSIRKTDINPDLAKTMRASVVLTGPMLARFGKVSFPAPGGCVIGVRPIDLFIEGYKEMGATVTLQNGIYEIQASQGLKGAEIKFKKISVGGTETLMMAAVLAEGKTVLKNCAMEPEITNVAEWLVQCGANIQGMGTETITVNGLGGKLLPPKSHYVAIPDRIEAGSFLILGALCSSRLTIANCRPDHLTKTIDMMREAGVSISVEGSGLNKDIVVTGIGEDGRKHFGSFNISTKEYPGFPTDLQPVMSVFLTQSEGESSVQENIFEGRFGYVRILNEMGADITLVNDNQILIKGPTSFISHDEEISAPDIRAGFALVLASILGKGRFVISNIHLIDRGYESLETRLKSVGVDIVRG